ncbi:MAG: efflux RND transporter periplasmic adaptor subunit [Marinilabiliales bacterium]|nr:MAG: efflux RND transporter periplasmic adaptor subunit [Marinilabiliales bacterium]
MLLIIIAIVGKKKGWFGAGFVYKVTVEKPEYRKITETITANGKIQPETEVKISSDVSGEIVELNVQEGQQVKEGKVLLKIDPDIYLSSIDRMEASLNSSKANLANSKARLAQIEAQFTSTKLTYERNQKLWQEKAISDADFEASKAAFEMGEAEVKASQESVNAAEFTVRSAEASLREAKENLAKTTIYAPVNGTVSMLNVEKGERVVGTIQMAGTEMLRIANLNEMEVKVEVNENDIVRVSLGDTAIVEVDAYLGDKFKGVVTEIANSANNSVALSADQVTSFDVKVRILSESYKHLIGQDSINKYPFRPGMSATVDIQTHTVNDALSVPIQAVTTRAVSDTLSKFSAHNENNEMDKTMTQSSDKEDEEVLEVVFVHKNGKVQIKEVTTGIQDNNYIRIISGIDTNDEVVTAPYSAISKRLRNSMKVEVTDKDKLFGQTEE